MPYPTELEALRERTEQGLQQLFSGCDGPEQLRQAMAYSLFAGGKRLRPALVVAARELFDTPGADPMPAACALEFIHTYSLIHDDLPAMDDDDLRRGQPTNHKRFGEALAILAGDGLLTEAFGLLARHYPEHPAAIQLVGELAAAAGAGGMVGGQVLDVEQTGRRLQRAELETIHRLKTAALMVAAVRCGGLLGGADPEALADLTAYGRAVGLAFQVADDVLDVIGDRAQLGKTAGKDAAQGKNTYVALLGTEGARAEAVALTRLAEERIGRFGPRAAPLAALAGYIRQSVEGDTRPA